MRSGSSESGSAPAVEQILDTSRATFARGIVQRGEATLVHIFRTRLRDDFAFPLVGLAAIVQVRFL